MFYSGEGGDYKNSRKIACTFAQSDAYNCGYYTPQHGSVIWIVQPKFTNLIKVDSFGQTMEGMNVFVVSSMGWPFPTIPTIECFENNHDLLYLHTYIDA